jgi:hypothetical protein
METWILNEYSFISRWDDSETRWQNLKSFKKEIERVCLLFIFLTDEYQIIKIFVMQDEGRTKKDIKFHVKSDTQQIMIGI